MVLGGCGEMVSGEVLALPGLPHAPALHAVDRRLGLAAPDVGDASPFAPSTDRGTGVDRAAARG